MEWNRSTVVDVHHFPRCLQIYAELWLMLAITSVVMEWNGANTRCKLITKIITDYAGTCAVAGVTHI